LHLVGQLLTLIHDARTREHKIHVFITSFSTPANVLVTYNSVKLIISLTHVNVI